MLDKYFRVLLWHRIKLLLTFYVNIFTFTVKISFKTNRLERELTDPSKTIRAFGERAPKVRQRMDELRAAASLADMTTLPAAGFRPLTENRRGQFAVRVSNNYRIVFVPACTPIPRKADGGYLLEEISEIEIVAVEDYH